MRTAAAVLLASVAGGFSPFGGGCGGACPTTRRYTASMKQEAASRPSLEDVIWGAVLDWFKNSEMAAKRHQEHVNGDGVTHMMKGTPFVNAPDALKLRFVNDGAGRLVSEFMRREQRELGERSSVGVEIEGARGVGISPGDVEDGAEAVSRFAVDQLAYLIKKFGAGHVLLGTDYPADMGEYDPVEHVYQVEGLIESDREKICGLNALSLMGLEQSQFKR